MLFKDSVVELSLLSVFFFLSISSFFTFFEIREETAAPIKNTIEPEKKETPRSLKRETEQ